MKIVLISTYELGRQPFGLSSPAAWFKGEGVTVTCLDLSIQSLKEESILEADIIAFYVPMHTATRIALPLLKKIKKINADAHLCFYGLYASANEKLFRKLGVNTILGGEFEEGLISMVKRLSSESPNKDVQQEPLISLAKQKFIVPDRNGLPKLEEYAYLNLGVRGKLVVGYTEASRGCKHTCLHCPIVPIYQGQFRVIQKEVVLADIKNQVQAGAEHITFGDPDFFNGIGHALPIVKTLHQEFPNVTYDVTIKVEHLLKYAQHLPLLKQTGCLFVTTAVESFDNKILEILDKGHTTEDFKRILLWCNEIGLILNPTFVAFNPWITVEGYLQMLNTILELNLVEHTSPVQYSLRLLIPSRSMMLGLPFIEELVGEFDEEALCYPWSHPDLKVDQFQREVMTIVKECLANAESRFSIFNKILNLTYDYLEVDAPQTPQTNVELTTKLIPQMSEFWYC